MKTWAASDEEFRARGRDFNLEEMANGRGREQKLKVVSTEKDVSEKSTKDCSRLNDVDRVKQLRPQSDHPNQQCPVTAPQSNARRILP
jgi:hypothetical protein